MYRRFLSTRYLRTRFVNLISVAAVMVGVAVLIVVTSVMDGFQEKVREIVRGTLSHVIMEPDGSLGEEQPLPPYAEIDAKLREDARILATAPQVTAFVGYPYRRGQMHKGVPSFHLMEAVGIDWDKESRVSEITKYLKHAEEKGRPFLNARALERQKKTAIISRAFAEQFFFLKPEEIKDGEAAAYGRVVGADLELMFPRQKEDESYTADTYRAVVSGVYDAEDQNADFGRVFLDREQLREMARIEPEYMQIRVALKDYAQADAVVASIHARIPGFHAQSWESMRAHFLRAVKNEKVLMMIVLSFIVMLAGFTILATLTLTVVEKTKDIGIIKALGGTTGGILSLFLRSGLLIGVLGAALGVGLGYYVTNHVNSIKDGLEKIGIQIFPPDIYLFREIPTLIVWPTIAGIVAGTILLTFLAGLAPALRAARMDPIVALRYE